MGQPLWKSLSTTPVGRRSIAASPQPEPTSHRLHFFSREENTIMRSISTMRGDAGETSLAGGLRVSKASARVEAYGTIDELISSLGVARSMCDDGDIATLAKSIQQDLFKLGSSLATP